ncbi:MAG: hypothetical protein KY475_17570 [Planctomycetes bacterium]|nr:hypothetical protein [Planctomycetota bacterium]
MSEATPLATHEHQPGDFETTLAFLKRAWAELRQLRLARVWPNRMQVIDINGDAFEIRRLGYRDADIVPTLRAVNAAFNPETIHEPTAEEYKEFKTGRRYPWAADRVM